MRIDPHVHFRDEEQDYKETIAHGLLTATEQGVDYVIDMPNTFRPIYIRADVSRRLKRVPKAQKGRYFLYVGVTKDPDQIAEAVDLVKTIPEVAGLKMFAGQSTGDLAIIKEQHQRSVFTNLAKLDYRGVIAEHCEKELYVKDIFDPKDPYTHALSRPKIAEIESVRDIIRFATEENFKGTLHICHVSCPEAVELIKEAGKDIRITCGVTPHHLMWNDEKLKGSHGLLYKMNPPLRSLKDMLELRECLKQGHIDWIETDHAPHTIGEKLYSGAGCPSGYPSLYLYKELVDILMPKWGISKEQIENLTFNNIIKAFNLNI